MAANNTLTLLQDEMLFAAIVLLAIELDLGPLVRIECDVLNL